MEKRKAEASEKKKAEENKALKKKKAKEAELKKKVEKVALEAALKEKKELEEKNQEDDESDDESVIGEITKPDRIRKIREMYYDVQTQRLVFLSSWFRYDKSHDTTEEIDTFYAEFIRKYIFVYFLFLHIHSFTMCFQIIHSNASNNQVK